MKKAMAWVLALAFVLGLASVQMPAAAEGGEVHKMVYVVPGAAQPDEDLVMAELNAKLQADGVALEVSREFIPWDVWADKLNLKLTSGEEFDMFHIMQDWIPYNNYKSRDALVDITDLLEEHGPVIMQKLPAEMLNGSKIGGRNYIVPTYWVELSIDTPIFYRQDIMDEYGLDIPEDQYDILEDLKTVRADWKGANLPLLNFSIATYDAATTQLSPKIHRLYDRYPFIVKDQFFQIFQDGKVESWFESEEFRQDCEFMHKAYEEGLIQPDILSVNFDWANNYNAQGDWYIWTTVGIKETRINNPEIQPEDVKTFRFKPEIPAVRNWGVKNCNGVSVTSKYPQGPIQFINWLWSDQANHDLYVLGQEGVHWERVESDERAYAPINDPNTNQNNYQTGDEWKIGFIEMVRYSTGAWPVENQGRYTPDASAVNSVAGSFFFDATGVATEYANLQAEAATVMTPLVMGVQSYEEAYEAAIQRLKVAGLDAVVAEYQRQLTEFIQAQ